MNKQNRNWKSTALTVLLTLVLAVAVTYLYSKIDRKHTKKQEIKTEVGQLLEMNLEDSYPATARQVVKTYLSIMSCYYKEPLKESELEGLVKQSMKLYDEELKEKNPYKGYLENLKKEIKEYANKDMILSDYQIEDGKSIQYYSIKGKEYASVLVTLVKRDADLRYKTNEEFVLRKDSDGKYRILGWQIVKDGVK